MSRPLAKPKSAFAGAARPASVQCGHTAASLTPEFVSSRWTDVPDPRVVGSSGPDRHVRGAVDLTIQNNFDLIRLFAALQVMVGHVLWHMGHEASPMAALLGALPGVPVFFFTSGFLISGTYERNPALWDYARNRILRIYPALWASVILSFVLISIFYFKAFGWPLFGWSLMQATVLQDWNPPFLRGYGIGVANGSLWTIPVELSFYAATPVIYWISRHNVDKALFGIAFVSFSLLQILMLLPAGGFWQKAGLLTPIPWIGMFAFGALARRYLHLLKPFVAGQFFWWLALFVVTVFIGRQAEAPRWLFRSEVNPVGLLQFVVMAGLVLSAACSRPRLANRILRRNDISYGIYILHMPIINALLENGLRSYVLAIGLTLLAATASWFLIERPALRLKRAPRRPIAEP